MSSFAYTTAWSLFFPYLTLQMVQTGLTIEEIAVIYAVLPFAACIAPPVAGKSEFIKHKT